MKDLTPLEQEGYVKITIDADTPEEVERVSRLIFWLLYRNRGWLLNQVSYTSDGAKSLWYDANTTKTKETDNVHYPR